MRKYLAVALLLPTLLLGGCQGLNKIIGIQNPISNNALGAAISSYGIIDTAVIAYRGLPRCTVTHNFSATNICYKRSVLVNLQSYDEAANAAINKAVAFQRNNPTLDASSYIDAAVSAVDVFKKYAVTNNLPGVQ